MSQIFSWSILLVTWIVFMNGVFKSCEARKSAVFVPYIISLFSDDEDYKMARRAKPKVKKYKGIQSDRKFSKKGRFSFFF